MQELERGRHGAVRPLQRRASADECAPPRQRVENRLHLARRLTSSRADRRSRTCTAEDACHFEQSTLPIVEPIDLALDGFPDVDRDPKGSGIDVLAHGPATLAWNDDAPGHEIGQDVHDEEGIAFGVLVDEPCEPFERRAGVRRGGKARAKVFDHGLFVEPRQRNLGAESLDAEAVGDRLG